MESVIDKYFCLIVDKIECSLFGHDNSSEQGRRINHPFLITQTDFVRTDFVNHLQLQAFFGLLFNIYLFAVLFLYVPINFSLCWTCSSPMTIWLAFMGVMSTFVIIPKIILLRKLLRIEETSDPLAINYFLWSFFHSKAFIFNKRVSLAIKAAYLVGFGMFNIIGLNREGCESMFGLVAFLLMCFLVMIVASFWKQLNNFLATIRLETVFQSMKETFIDGIYSLEVINGSVFKERFNTRDPSCSICFNDYEDQSVLRVMKCPGSHAFHKECIDKWLENNGRCPQCNLSVLGQ